MRVSCAEVKDGESGQTTILEGRNVVGAVPRAHGHRAAWQRAVAPERRRYATDQVTQCRVIDRASRIMDRRCMGPFERVSVYQPSKVHEVLLEQLGSIHFSSSRARPAGIVTPQGGCSAGETCVKFPIDQDEGDTTHLIAAVRPGVVRSDLYHDVAGSQECFAVVEDEEDFTLKDDSVVNGLRTVHHRMRTTFVAAVSSAPSDLLEFS
jgi:hypothetical protein